MKDVETYGQWLQRLKDERDHVILVAKMRLNEKYGRFAAPSMVKSGQVIRKWKNLSGIYRTGGWLRLGVTICPGELAAYVEFFGWGYIITWVKA